MTSSSSSYSSYPSHSSLKSRNPLVTQTVEVMHQTEMIQTLIDTYADKSNGKYVLNHNQILPNIDFPLENTANLLNDRKFAKPLWFIRPQDTRFTRGIPRPIPPVTKPIVNVCLRKSLCGLLQMSDFMQSTDSALILFTDAIDHFYKSFMDCINEAVLLSEPSPGADKRKKLPNDKNRKLDVAVVEKAYRTMTSESLTCLHNYYKNTIIAKNTQEIEEFSDIFGEYKKLQQTSQDLHRSANPMREDENIVGYVDYLNQSIMSLDGQQQHHHQQMYAQEGMNQIMEYVDGTDHQGGGPGQDQEYLINVQGHHRVMPME